MYISRELRALNVKQRPSSVATGFIKFEQGVPTRFILHDIKVLSNLGAMSSIEL